MNIRVLSGKRLFLRRQSLHQNALSFSEPFLGEAEAECVTKVIKSGRLVMGPEVYGFEKDVADYCGKKHAIAVTSGTSALTLCMAALEVGQHSLVVVPAYTWVATYNAPSLLGARVTVADVDSHSYCMDPIATKLALEKRLLKSKESFSNIAAIPVHLFGHRCPPPLGPIDITIGDGCCAFAGVDSDGSMCGDWNAVECFSFHPRKVVTTGEGGMVMCSDDDLASKLRMLRDHGAHRTAEQRRQTVSGGDMVPQFPVAGFNFRMTEMQGALGRAQMSRVEDIVAIRRHVARVYDMSLQDLQSGCVSDEPYVRLPLSEQPGARRVLTMYTVQLRSGTLDAKLLALQQGLLEHGDALSPVVLRKAQEVVDEVNRLKTIRSAGMLRMVTAGVIVRPPMISLLDVEHVQRDYAHYEAIDLRDDVMKAVHFPGTYVSASLNFALPLHPLMTQEDAERAANCLRRAFRPAFIGRAGRAASDHPVDFTIQYPIRREYFGQTFKIVSNGKGHNDTAAAGGGGGGGDQDHVRTPLSAATSDVLSRNLHSFQRALAMPTPRELVKNMNMLLYLHIPFCASKCNYCNFAVDTTNTSQRHAKYVSHLAALTTQWVAHIQDPSNSLTVSGIDIGKGGLRSVVMLSANGQLMTVQVEGRRPY
jgi:perosamine synthetase